MQLYLSDHRVILSSDIHVKYGYDVAINHILYSGSGIILCYWANNSELMSFS